MIFQFKGPVYDHDLLQVGDLVGGLVAVGGLKGALLPNAHVYSHGLDEVGNLIGGLVDDLVGGIGGLIGGFVGGLADGLVVVSFPMPMFALTASFELLRGHGLL